MTLYAEMERDESSESSESESFTNEENDFLDDILEEEQQEEEDNDHIEIEAYIYDKNGDIVDLKPNSRKVQSQVPLIDRMGPRG